MNKSGQFVLVVLQFASAAALVLAARDVFAQPCALALVIIGMATGIWSWVTFGLRDVSVMPELRDSARLVTSGPYRFMRHPMYTAVLIFGGGFVFMAPAWWKLAAWLVLLFAVTMKSLVEERLLRERFTEYDAYANRTGRFLPRLRKPRT